MNELPKFVPPRPNMSRANPAPSSPATASALVSKAIAEAAGKPSEGSALISVSAVVPLSYSVTASEAEGAQGVFYPAAVAKVWCVDANGDRSRNFAYFEATAAKCPTAQEIGAELAVFFKHSFHGLEFPQGFKEAASKIHQELARWATTLGTEPLPN